jgi:two-component system response regulator
MPDGKTILLAEDSPYDAELVQAALTSTGLGNRVVRVEDGVEALDFLRRSGRFAGRESGVPVVVILDLKMPRMDGVETLREIRKDPALRHLPVVMLTSSRENGDLLRCYEGGANAYVVKPVPFDEFLPAVRSIGQFWGVVNVPVGEGRGDGRS